MSVETLIQLGTSGLALGAVYALVALGFVIIYRASEVFNFAQGDLVTVGAFLMVSLSAAGLPWGAALALAIALTGLLGAVVERVVLRPLVGRPVHVSIILTIVLGTLLRLGVVLVWGSQPRGMPTPWDTTGAVSVAGSHVLYNALAAVGLGVVTIGGYVLVSRFTRLGLGMRASASDQEAALAVGVPVGGTLGATWFIAAASAALAGVALGMFPRSVEPNLSFVALRAFPAVIVGGLDSVAGTVVAALALGLMEVLAQAYLNPHLGALGHNFHAVFPYLVMVLFLMFRPYGLLGRREVERL